MPSVACRYLLLPLVGLLVGLAPALPAHAHERVAAPTPGVNASLTASAPAPADPATAVDIESILIASDSVQASPVFMLIAALALALLGLLGRRPSHRRVVTILLVVVLTAIAFETGVHAVHHLGDSQAANRCVVAASTDHVLAIDLDAPPEVGSYAEPGTHVAPPTAASEANDNHRRDVPRAPPTSTV